MEESTKRGALGTVREEATPVIGDVGGNGTVAAASLAAAFMRSSTVAMFAKDRAGRYVLLNAACESLFGTSADQVLGRTDCDVLPERDAALVVANDRSVIDTGATYEFEETLAFPSGRRTLLTSKMPLRDRSGKIVGLCGVATDITARKTAERQARESEARFRALADSAPMLVWMSDRNKDGTYFNQSWLDFTGRRLDQELGTGWLESVHPDDFGALAACERALETREPFTTQFRLRSARGDYRWLLDSGAPRFDADGEFLGFIGCCVDITERYEAERAKDEFLAILGHELRNPLAPLKAGVELLDRARKDPSLLDDLHPMMDRQLRHLVRLVDDLVDMSRISRGGIELQRTGLDLRGPISGAIEQMRTVIAERGHVLRVELADAPLPVHGDADRLTQVLANLLSNAANYMDPGGAVSVKSGIENGQAVVRVRDTGYGIPPELADKVFDLFAQVPEHRARTGGSGLGVGLALARQVISMHGGSIALESAGLTRGSVFVVRLPLGDAASIEQTAADDDRDGASALRQRVLIIDDNGDAAESLRMMLELSGHAVATASDGPAGLEHMERDAPDIVLLDIGLPGMDGYEVARRIRALPRGRDVRLIAVTGWGQDADKKRAVDAEFDEHLVKPVDLPTITSVLCGTRPGR